MTKKIRFGTDGWRAIIAEDFTFDNVTLVTKAIIGYITENYPPEKPVVICYDTRFLADKFAKRAAETINEYGLNVKLVNHDAPTPVAAFSAKFLASAGALMFTASHNPPEYCGIKYIPHYAGPATGDITDAIVRNVKQLQRGDDSFLSKPMITGKTDLFDPKPDYIEALKKIIDLETIKKNPIKLIYDPLYSTGRGYLDEILTEIGCEVEVIHNWIDPLYGGGMPEPKEECLGELVSKIKGTDIKLGLSTDGDADRFGVIDEDGNYISPNLVLAILLKHLVKNRNFIGSVVRSLATTHLIDVLADKYSLEVIETPVGFKYIGEVMRKEDVIIGGEESGGLSILGHIPEKDGILANLLIVEAIAYENKSVKELKESVIEEAGKEFYNDRLDLKVSEKVKSDFVKRFATKPPKNIAGISVEKVSTLDGAKLYFSDGSWILTRPSGTEPLLRIYFEASSEETLDLMKKEIQEIVKDFE